MFWGQGQGLSGRSIGESGGSSTTTLADMPQHEHVHKFGSTSTFGGSGAHGNMDPFLAITFSIALSGIYPPTRAKRAESEDIKHLSLRAYDPFIGQIIMTGFNFPPAGFASCDGSLLQRANYPDLFR